MRYTTVFLDRDGVINQRRENDYVKDWSEFVFLPGVIEALGILTRKGIRLIVVSNQRGVATGAMTAAAVEAIHKRMLRELASANVDIAAVFYCPHDRDQCDCRKPGVGLFLQARDLFPEIEFGQSIMVGDSVSDMEAGEKIGCRNIFIGEDSRWESALSLYDAVERLIA